MNPDRLFRALARAEVVTWTLLLLGMFVKYVLDGTEVLVRVGGGLHGLVFLAYCLVALLVSVDARWRPRRIAAGLGSAFVPYLSVVFERHVEAANGLPARWRLREGSGTSPAERLVSACLRAPVLASVAAAVGVAVVFTALLAVGPPTSWGR
jgi:integral membrane protein